MLYYLQNINQGWILYIRAAIPNEQVVCRIGTVLLRHRGGD